MAAILRFRKLCFLEPSSCNDNKKQTCETPKSDEKIKENCNWEENGKEKEQKRRGVKEWRCIDNCCWMIGLLCTAWWLLLFLHHCMPAALPGAEPPGTRLRRHGFAALHPVVMVPGIVTGGLELWEGRPCSDGLFRQRLWGGSFAEIFKRFEYY